MTFRFYTNVQLIGDNFLVRGYENGKHFSVRENLIQHFLFLQIKKQNIKHWKVTMLNQ